MIEENEPDFSALSAARANFEIGLAVLSAKSGIGHSKEQVFSWLDALADGRKLSVPAPDILPVK
jgi:hypothetical protein